MTHLARGGRTCIAGTRVRERRSSRRQCIGARARAARMRPHSGGSRLSSVDLAAGDNDAAIARSIADLDRRDPLRPVRDQFEIPAGLIYLDGNSLGALARPVAERVRAVLAREWG